jgi:hypothetical protein
MSPLNKNFIVPWLPRRWDLVQPDQGRTAIAAKRIRLGIPVQVTRSGREAMDVMLGSLVILTDRF